MIFILILLRNNYFTDNLLKISQSWSQKPIIDILALEIDEPCPEYYKSNVSRIDSFSRL